MRSCSSLQEDMAAARVGAAEKTEKVKRQISRWAGRQAGRQLTTELTMDFNYLVITLGSRRLRDYHLGRATLKWRLPDARWG